MQHVLQHVLQCILKSLLPSPTRPSRSAPLHMLSLSCPWLPGFLNSFSLLAFPLDITCSLTPSLPLSLSLWICLPGFLDASPCISIHLSFASSSSPSTAASVSPSFHRSLASSFPQKSLPSFLPSLTPCPPLCPRPPPLPPPSLTPSLAPFLIPPPASPRSPTNRPPTHHSLSSLVAPEVCEQLAGLARNSHIKTRKHYHNTHDTGGVRTAASGSGAQHAAASTGPSTPLGPPGGLHAHLRAWG